MVMVRVLNRNGPLEGALFFGTWNHTSSIFIYNTVSVTEHNHSILYHVTWLWGGMIGSWREKRSNFPSVFPKPTSRTKPAKPMMPHLPIIATPNYSPKKLATLFGCSNFGFPKNGNHHVFVRKERHSTDPHFSPMEKLMPWIGPPCVHPPPAPSLQWWGLWRRLVSWTFVEETWRAWLLTLITGGR